MFTTAKIVWWCALAPKDAACLKFFHYDSDPPASRSRNLFLTHTVLTSTAASHYSAAITADNFANNLGKAPGH